MARGCDVHGMHATTFEAEKCARSQGHGLFRRVLSAYGRMHPSMYQFMVWRMSKANAQTVADAAGVHVDIDFEGVSIMLGMPVEFVDSDEILLVLKA